VLAFLKRKKGLGKGGGKRTNKKKDWLELYNSCRGERLSELPDQNGRCSWWRAQKDGGIHKKRDEEGGGENRKEELNKITERKLPRERKIYA